MGGYGNPLKTLDTPKPVKDEVADAFTQGLQARGMLASSPAPFRIFMTLRKFDADMIVGRTARIDLTMQIADQVGRIVFQRDVADSVSDMKFFETGVFAEIGDLKVLAQTVLSRTVDKLLDDPSFRSVIRYVSFIAWPGVGRPPSTPQQVGGPGGSCRVGAG